MNGRIFRAGVVVAVLDEIDGEDVTRFGSGDYYVSATV
jgi:hypothetical protein